MTMSKKVPKRVTIYDPRDQSTKEYQVYGTRESQDRGSEIKYGRDGLVYGLCHWPPREVTKAITSGRHITYHWED